MGRSTACDWRPCGHEEIKSVAIQSLEKMKMLKDGQLVQEKAAFFKALGDETRLRIIGMLNIQDLCLCEIVSGLDIPSSTISHHLQVLERGGVIHSRKEGKYTVFALNREVFMKHTIGIIGNGGNKMVIKILGSGCANCQKLEANAKEAIAALGMEAEFVKVQEVQDILAYGVMKTPALVIDEEVKVMGRVPSVEEIKKLL